MIRALLVSSSMVAALAATSAQAAAPFPIAELDNCRDAKECALYCEIPAHKATCWAYQSYTMLNPTVLGETTETPPAGGSAPQKTLVFPIAALDNCTSLQACKIYCDVPANITACREFGQQQGLTRASSNYGQQTALLAQAKEELGCTSLPQCRTYCNDPVNAEQCQTLATKFAPMKYRLARESLLEKARLLLNCTTLEECRAKCADTANALTCQAFAQQHTPPYFRQKMDRATSDTAEESVPLPCTTLAECQAYCSDPAHATACSTVANKNQVHLQVQQERNFTCNTKAECERYCQTNPTECPAYAQSKDYERLKLQQQLRTQANPVSKPQLERYQRSLLEKPTISPSSAPAN